MRRPAVVLALGVLVVAGSTLFASSRQHRHHSLHVRLESHSAHGTPGSFDGLNTRVLAERLWAGALAAQWRSVAAQQQIARARARHSVPPSRVSSGGGRCGGVLPPCYVMWRESRGRLDVKNPDSTASGKWQFLDSTWARFGGYARAADAPESVQDARAAALWDGGAGCAHWQAC